MGHGGHWFGVETWIGIVGGLPTYGVVKAMDVITLRIPTNLLKLLFGSMFSHSAQVQQ